MVTLGFGNQKPGFTVSCVFTVHLFPFPVQILVQNNCLTEQIRVLEGRLEEVSCPEMVDIIVSEPMGYMLLNLKLMESFLHARKWLKPNGRTTAKTHTITNLRHFHFCTALRYEGPVKVPI